MRRGTWVIAAVAPLVAGAVLLLTTAAGATIRSDIYVANTDMAVSGKALPDPVTAGRLLAYDLTTSNLGPADATGVVLKAKLPGGVSLVSATPSQGACAASTDTVVCSLGVILDGSAVTARLVVDAPSGSGSISLKAKVTETKRDVNLSNNQSTVVSTVTGTSQDFAATFVLPPGGVVSTGSGTSGSNPQSTTARVPGTPAGVAVSIAESAANASASCGSGFSCVGQVVQMGLAGATLAYTRPLKLTMTLNRSELGGADGSTLPVFRNKILLVDCFGPRVAKPDPCVASRAVTPSGSVKIVVLTTFPGRYRA